MPALHLYQVECETGPDGVTEFAHVVAETVEQAQTMLLQHRPDRAYLFPAGTVERNIVGPWSESDTKGNSQ